MKILKTLSFALAVTVLCAGSVLGQETFFKGKTIRIIVPFSAGGGYDIYSRIIGRHMGKHIPGNPVVVSLVVVEIRFFGLHA